MPREITAEDVMEVVDPTLSLVGIVLNLCKAVYSMAMNAKANKERCKEVGQRVRALEKLVLKLKGRRRISSTVRSALKELSYSLESAMNLLERFSRTNAFIGFLKSSSIEENFTKVDKRLTNHLQTLSTALLIDQTDTLDKVYATVRRHSAPTPSAPSQNNMSTMMMSSPTAPFPSQSNMSTMTMSSPTPTFPFQSQMPTMTMSTPATPSYFYYNTPTMMVPSMPSMPYSTTTIVSSPTMSMTNLAQHTQSMFPNYFHF